MVSIPTTLYSVKSFFLENAKHSKFPALLEFQVLKKFAEVHSRRRSSKLDRKGSGLYFRSIERVMSSKVGNVQMDGQPAAESGQAPSPTRAPPSMSAQAMLSRYRWEELMDSEKDAVRDCIGIASTRAGIGLGAVLTIAAISSSRKYLCNVFIFIY